MPSVHHLPSPSSTVSLSPRQTSSHAMTRHSSCNSSEDDQEAARSALEIRREKNRIKQRNLRRESPAPNPYLPLPPPYPYHRPALKPTVKGKRTTKQYTQPTSSCRPIGLYDRRLDLVPPMAVVVVVAQVVGVFFSHASPHLITTLNPPSHPSQPHTHTYTHTHTFPTHTAPQCP